jgi:integrase
MASVRQLKTENREGKRPWVVEYTDREGKRRRATPPSGLKKDAEKLRQKIEREISDGTHSVDAERLTFGEATRAWLADCERRRKINDRMSGNTYDRICRAVKTHIEPEFSNRKLAEMRGPALQDFLDKKIVDYSRSTVLGLRLMMFQIFEFSIKREWIVVNPLVSKRVRVPMKPAKAIAIPSPEDIQIILRGLTSQNGTRTEHEIRLLRLVAITLAIFTGMRRGEILALQWGDIDLERRFISIKHSLSKFDGLKSTKTAAGVRTIPMSDPVYALLHELQARKGGNPTGYVLQRYGRPVCPIKLSGWVARFMLDIGLANADGKPKYSMHIFRHAAVSLLLKQGLQPMHIQRMVGHASIRTTLDTYGHLLPGDESGRLALNGVASQFAAVTPQIGTSVKLNRSGNPIHFELRGKAPKGGTRPKRDKQGKTLVIPAA